MLSFGQFSFILYTCNSELNGFLSLQHRLFFPKMVQGLVNFNKCICPSNLLTVNRSDHFLSIKCFELMFQILFKNILFENFKQTSFVLQTNFCIINNGVLTLITTRNHQKLKPLPFIFYLLIFNFKIVSKMAHKGNSIHFESCKCWSKFKDTLYC